MLEIPDTPRLGIDIFEDAIAENPYQPQALRHYTGQLTQIRSDNARGYLDDSGHPPGQSR
jgi:hypothetical protein